MKSGETTNQIGEENIKQHHGEETKSLKITQAKSRAQFLDYILEKFSPEQQAQLYRRFLIEAQAAFAGSDTRKSCFD